MGELSYFREVYTDNAVYSIDKLTVSFRLRRELLIELANDESALSRCCSLHLGDYFKRRYSDTYHYVGMYSKGVTISVRIIANRQTGENICYLDCNPNKCFDNQRCISDITFLLTNSYEYEIKTLDVAVDISSSRNMVSVKKDKRMMLKIIASKGDEGTVYLGKKRHHIGRVKVYDKQKERKLSSKLTRVEFTLGNPLKDDWIDVLEKKLPQIYIRVCKGNVNTDGINLSSTDRVLIQSLSQCRDKVNIFNQLDHKKKNKLESFVFYNEERFIFDVEIMHRVAVGIADFIKMGNAEIDEEKFVNR